ncbi:tail fiber assembly protein, partial [Escherichia coli]|uniref:tail fiber assembly protein n=1 Tax=Escherichia coli TaxID=562 RepID=UPI003CE5318F
NGTAWVKDTEAEKLFRIREAEETKNNLMQVASEHIAPLQDAADLEIATEEEISLLEAWKKYRVLLNGSDSNLLIVFYVQIMPDDLVMQLHR